MSKINTPSKTQAQRDARRRFSFGNAWAKMVRAGKIKGDFPKLIAHAVKLGVGDADAVGKMPATALLAAVAAKLPDQTVTA